MKPFVEYSGVDPDLLFYQGKQYEHLEHVLRKKTIGVPFAWPLKIDHISPPLPKYDPSATRELEEEKELLAKDKSEYSGLLAKWGISFAEIKAGPLSIDFNVLVPAVIQAGGDMVKALPPFGNTRVDDALTFPDLGAITPHVQHLLHLGSALKYDKPFAISKPSGLQLTHASLTFEEAAILMPILHALLFCGKLYHGNTYYVGSDLRKGFTLGLFSTTRNGSYIIRHRNTTVRKLVDEMWRKGACYTVPDDVQEKWERWTKFNQFDPRTRSRASSIRDLVRFCWNKCKVAVVVQDIESAAIAFGLAQVKLCRIEMLDMGPVDGVTVFGKREHQDKAVHLKPSVKPNIYTTFSYKLRKNIFDVCKVPLDSEEFLMNWLDKQIDKTHLLGIANGDPPGTVILTPEFSLLAKTKGDTRYLGEFIANIADAVSRKCAACNGECKGLLIKDISLPAPSRNCSTILFFSTLLTIYVGGVLLKAGMTVDQCTACSDAKVTWMAVESLGIFTYCGLDSLLACWFILRTGEDAPKNMGPVLGIVMEGQVHGLRHAIEPGTTGSSLVSFPGHIYQGRQTCSCLVFEKCDLSNDILMEKARTAVISEQAPDVQLQQLLFIHSRPNYIAVDTCLAYPDGRIVQVQLGGQHLINRNLYRCVDMSEKLYATPLQVSECTDGSSIVDTQSTGLRFAVYTYGNEAIQSWVCGLFRKDNIIFQGRRSLPHSLALLEEGDILIQGFSGNSNANHSGQSLESTVERLSIQN